MATKNEALRNKMAEDFGALWNNGTLVIRNSSNGVLVTFTLGATAFGSATAGKIAANGVPISAVASATGTAHNAVLTSSGGGTYVLSGLTVGTSSADVILSSLSINENQTVNLTKLEWTEAEGIA